MASLFDAEFEMRATREIPARVDGLLNSFWSDGGNINLKRFSDYIVGLHHLDRWTGFISTEKPAAVILSPPHGWCFKLMAQLHSFVTDGVASWLRCDRSEKAIETEH